MEYYKYLNNHINFSWFNENIQYKNYNPVPFCIPHVNSLNNPNLKFSNKFDKWDKLPNTSYKLYWKFHNQFWK